MSNLEEFPKFFFVDPQSVDPVQWTDLIGLEPQVQKIKSLGKFLKFLKFHKFTIGLKFSCFPTLNPVQLTTFEDF